jgi:hypothetical protein
MERVTATVRSLAQVSLAGARGGRRGPRVYRVVLIRAGEWRGKGLYAPPDALARAAPKFEGVASFLNPPARQPGQHGHPGLERLLGVIENAAWDEQASGIVADYRLAGGETAKWFGRLIDDWLAARDEGRPVPEVGLSAVLTVIAGSPRDDGLREVQEVLSVEQVDAVYRPAAGGEFVRVVNAEPAAGDAGQAAQVLDSLRASLVDARLAASGLPAAWQRVVRESLPEGWQVTELDAGIERVKAAWAEEQSRRTVQGLHPVDTRPLDGCRAGRVTQMLDSMDQIGEALDALVEGRSPRHGIRPLSGIREAYLMLSGDYEMTGLFHGDRVSLANVNSTTMAGLVANALNKVVVSEFQHYPRWWEPVVRREAFHNLQTIKWVKLGGVGRAAGGGRGRGVQRADVGRRDGDRGVAEARGLPRHHAGGDGQGRRGAAAQGPAGAGAGRVADAGQGGGEHLHGCQRRGPDDERRQGAVPRGPRQPGTAALSSSAWSNARLAMRKQSEQGSGERLGALTSPRYLLVPPDLEATALLAVGGEGLPVLANGDVSAEGADFEARLNAAKRRVIVVDLWTDANNWAAVADPKLFPTIGLGFRYGETPEIFSVASPTSGLLFTNDVLPVKVRWFFAAGAMDWRGVYKANVA